MAELERSQGLLGVHKPGQGMWVRIAGFVFVMAIMLFGCYELYIFLNTRVAWFEVALFYPPRILERIMGKAPITRALLASIGLFLVAGGITYLVFNRPRLGDFLIDTEGELRKVSWPARREYLGASVVIIFLIVFTSLFLAAVDTALSWLLGDKLKIGL